MLRSYEVSNVSAQLLAIDVLVNCQIKAMSRYGAFQMGVRKTSDKRLKTDLSVNFTVKLMKVH